jgi:putative NIF3 family GTP cyclohydrolase 1 type 2
MNEIEDLLSNSTFLLLNSGHTTFSTIFDHFWSIFGGESMVLSMFKFICIPLTMSILMFSCKNTVERQPAVLANNFENLMTAGEVISRIKKKVTCDWREETVDTYKSGTDASEVSGIATTFLATLDVLQRAYAQGCNMIITHEPTYYNHRDEIEFFKDDPVFEAKKAFIDEHKMIIFRFHDHWHLTKPDGIYEGMLDELGWKSFQDKQGDMVFTLPEQSVGDLARMIKRHFTTPAVRVVGDPDQLFHKVGLSLGAPGSESQIKMLRRDDVEVLITGETHEWETVEWVRDAVTEGKSKALLLIGHANSEEAGMNYCAEWLKGFISEVPVKFIPAGDPFWGPE